MKGGNRKGGGVVEVYVVFLFRFFWFLGGRDWCCFCGEGFFCDKLYNKKLAIIIIIMSFDIRSELSHVVTLKFLSKKKA